LRNGIRTSCQPVHEIRPPTVACEQPRKTDHVAVNPDADMSSDLYRSAAANQSAPPVFFHSLRIGAAYMNLLLTGQHVDISPALREYVETKLERVTRHFDQIIEIEVVLGVEKPSEKDKRQRAEVNLRVKGNVVHLDHYAEDLYAAIDGLMDKLDRQVIRHKDKIQSHQHESVKRASIF
jgi:putative sigma-54 modulation protein